MTFFQETSSCACKSAWQEVPSAISWALIGFCTGSLLCWWLLIGRQALRLPSLGLDWNVREALRSLCTIADSSLTLEEERFLARRRFEKVQTLIHQSSIYVVPSINFLAIGLAGCALSIQPSTIFFCFYQAILGEGLLFTTFCLFFAFYKTQLSMRVAEAIMVILFLLIGVHGAFSVTDYAFVSSYHRFAVLAQLSISFFLASPRLLLVPNTINFAFQMLVVLCTPALMGDFQQHVACFVLSFSFNHAASSAAAAGLRYESRAMAAGHQASQGEATAMSLLSAMCDAVVILRPDLTLRATSQKLNALLLRTGFGAGDLFTRLLQLEDAQRFVDFIQRQSQKPTQAAVLHVHLVDSMGNKIAARLFHTCTISDDDGSLTHMVGVAEEREENADHFPSGGEYIAPASQQGAAGTDWLDFARIVPSGRAGFDSCSQVSSQRSLDRNAPTATVTLRTSLSCQVMGECEVGRTLFGFGSDSQLTFLSRIKQWKKLLMTLELMHAELACGSDAQPQRFGEVNIFVPATQTEHRGVLEIAVANVVNPEDGEDESTVHLNYCDFHLHFHQRSVQSSLGRLEGRPQSSTEEPNLPGVVPAESPSPQLASVVPAS